MDKLKIIIRAGTSPESGSYKNADVAIIEFTLIGILV